MLESKTGRLEILCKNGPGFLFVVQRNVEAQELNFGFNEQIEVLSVVLVRIDRALGSPGHLQCVAASMREPDEVMIEVFVLNHVEAAQLAPRKNASFAEVESVINSDRNFVKSSRDRGGQASCSR